MSDRHAAEAGSIPWCGKGFFSPESPFGANSLAVSVHPPCAITCVNICSHVRDPVVRVRVRWIMETLKKNKKKNKHRRLGSATLSRSRNTSEVIQL